MQQHLDAHASCCAAAVSPSLPCLQIAAWLAARALQLDATTGQLPEALQLLELAVDKGYGSFQVQLPDSGTSTVLGLSQEQQQQSGEMGEEHLAYPMPSCFGGGVRGRQPLCPLFGSAAVAPACFGGKACTWLCPQPWRLPVLAGKHAHGCVCSRGLFWRQSMHILVTHGPLTGLTGMALCVMCV